MSELSFIRRVLPGADKQNLAAEAAISNDNNSEEVKERARDRLEQMAADGELGEEAHQAQVKTGHKVVSFLAT